MANVLGELFQKIADAIREQTGETGTMKPADFPGAILGIEAGSDITLIDNIDITPDFSNGNQFVVAAEGYAVKGATILKPETLIPENIAEGVEIAGVVGTMGGGSSNDVRYVTFMNGDTVLYKKPVAVGDDCVDVLTKGLISTPTKESTAQFDYTYYGWGASNNGAADANILKNITEDKTVYAIYTSTLREYTITYLDSDGVTVLKTEQLPYGTVPSYVPSKEGAAFDGWTPSLAAVTGDATYTAKWIEAIGGSCGDDARWTYNVNTKTLTISGTGSTAQYTNAFNQPWNEYNAEIETVVVNEGITWLGQIAGSYIFANLTALKNVSLPNTLTHMWEGSFYQCTALESIEIPASVVTIYKYSFRYCSALANVTLHDGLTQIGERSFQRCSALKEFIMPNTVKTISSHAFDDSGLTSVTISGSVVWNDGTYVFNNCTNLANVTLNDGLTRISNMAFTSCAVTSITIPDSVTYIGQKAFNNKLTSATFNNPNGWWVSTSSSATSGTSVTVTNPATAATLLGSTYKDYYWKRT